MENKEKITKGEKAKKRTGVNEIEKAIKKNNQAKGQEESRGLRMSAVRTAGLRRKRHKVITSL